MDTEKLINRFNLLGKVAGNDDSLIRLDPCELVGLAMSSTGLDDFGEAGLPNSYYDFFDGVFGALGGRSVISRLRFRANMLRLLRNRLLMIDILKRSPAILNEDVSDPIIITGNPRTGTSILFELLAQDRRFRTVSTWEANFPVELPGVSLHRAELAQAVNDIVMDLQPDLKMIHEFKADLPAECFQVMEINFRLGLCAGNDYVGWLNKMDAESSYSWHKRVLQVLQSQAPRGRRWLLKCPLHLHFLDEVFRAYPRARIIYTHRDPVQSMPSMLSMERHVVSMDGNLRLDSNPKDSLRLWECGTRKVMAERTNGVIPHGSVTDVHFAAFINNPLNVIEQIYAHLGIDFSKDVRGRMDSWLLERPRGANGKHDYRSTDFGLSDIEIREWFRFYTERYEIKAEAG